MPSDAVPEVELGPLCTKIGSGATPRGGEKVYLPHGVASLIRSQNIYNDGFRTDGLVYLAEENASQLANVEVEAGDVLLNITGDSVARCCQVDPGVLPARVNQHVAIIRPRRDELDPAFLRYFLVSPRMQAQMLAWAHAGATRNALTKGMIESFKVPKPHICTQRRIAASLGSLDNKIALNRRMNRTLERMAQTLFRSWFIDFDPVLAKAEGDPIAGGLPDHLASLFPDRLVDSELGEIPEGWEVKSLDEIAHYLNGLACQKHPPVEGRKSLPVIKIRELRQGITASSDRATVDVATKYIVEDGDILFSWSGSLLVSIWCNGRGVLNQHVFKVTSGKYPKWYFYHATKHYLEEFQRIAADKATTMGHIQRHHLSGAKLAVPPDVLLNAASEVLGTAIDRRINALKQARTLSLIRDTLLPKLLSGEMEIAAAEAAVEEVAG